MNEARLVPPEIRSLAKADWIKVATDYSLSPRAWEVSLEKQKIRARAPGSPKWRPTGPRDN